MIYPTRSDYQNAMYNAPVTLSRPDLKAGLVKRDAMGLPMAWTGQFSAVFRVEAGGKPWALRCFIADIGEAAFIYDAIGRHLEKIRSPYFVGFEFHEAGILVNGTRHPLVQMEWVSGRPFKDFIEKNLDEPARIRGLAGAFREMLTHLVANQVAHGDLQHGNILILDDQATPEIKLIDYDTVVVPEVVGLPENNAGLPSYQHPRRRALATTKDLRIDAFSGAAIYASLVAFAEAPGLWGQFHVATREALLFDRKDFEDPERSPVLSILDGMSAECRELSRALRRACAAHPLEVPQLDELLKPRATKARWRLHEGHRRPAAPTPSPEPVPPEDEAPVEEIHPAPDAIRLVSPRPPPDLERLRALARRQRVAVFAMLTLGTLYTMLLALYLAEPERPPLFWMLYVVKIAAFVPLIRLSSALNSRAMTVILVLLVALPVVDVFVLLALSSVASGRFLDAGIRVGLFGLSPGAEQRLLPPA